MFSRHKILDFHTHSQRGDEHTTEVVSLHPGKWNPHTLFTIGYHPWFTNEPLGTQELNHLLEYLENPLCLALGEVGLDKLKGPSLPIQQQILTSQLQLAAESHKSVVIHCVRSYDPLIKIKRQFPSIQHWCIHGYGRNATLAQQLVREGFYLSIMPGLPRSKYDELGKVIPLHRLFLETDSMPSTTIQSVYDLWCEILSLPMEELCLRMNENATEFFQK